MRDAPLTPYEPLVDMCRESLRAVVGEGPYGGLLASYVAGGKMLRPLLAFVACDAVGSQPSSAMHAAEAIQLIHAASLVHDDLIDEAAVRRGRPALHRELGAEVALVLGDRLLAQAFVRMSSVAETVGTAVASRCVSLLGEHTIRCCDGQLHELEDASSGDYVAVARGKTASQFVAAAVLGGILGGATENDAALLTAYADALGVAFQVQDDLRDGARVPPDVAPDAHLARALAALAGLRWSRGRFALETLARVALTLPEPARAAIVPSSGARR